MKKSKYIAIALLLAATFVKANPVAFTNAQKVALNFYNHAFNSNASTQTLVYTERDANGQPVYYVFNINNNKGFVIVSAEDATVPVLGYSNEGPYVIPVAGNNVDFWMTRRKNEIIAIRTQNVVASPDITDKWTEYINNTPEKNTHSDMSFVLPLCATTWDQPYPYNFMCPGYPNNALTGCVATTMAQIMKYWSYPSKGISSNCYFDDIKYGFQENYGQLCETFDTVNYQWSSMPDNITGKNYAVSKIMYDCGVSVNMDYSPTSSGSVVIGGEPSAIYSYSAYFGYDPSTIQGYYYADYSESAWQGLLKTELNAGRPVQYMGTDESYGGHSWVCDGYNSTGDFHMNWGWSGQEDGYFSVALLNPYPYDFSYEYVGAIMGIEPDKSLAVPQVSNNSTMINVYPNPSQGTFTFDISTNLKNAQLKIYNTIGQEVSYSTVNMGKNLISLNNQPAGIYLYRLLNENGEPVSTGKLILNN